jgi:hypothetical protein
MERVAAGWKGSWWRLGLQGRAPGSVFIERTAMGWPSVTWTATCRYTDTLSYNEEDANDAELLRWRILGLLG